MSRIDISARDASATLAFLDAAQVAEERAQVDKLSAAAHWADLHAVLDRPGSVLPGCEQLRLLGGVGTPEVAEFCTAEFGAVMGVSDTTARRLVAAGLDLRHRLPRLWARVRAGQVKPWIGRQTAEATRHLSVETVTLVDRRVAPFAHGLSWGRVEAIIAAAWMQTDPEAAAAADAEAEATLGVWLNPSTGHGTKTIFIKAEAPARHRGQARARGG